jgi:hypothetical protein
MPMGEDRERLVRARMAATNENHTTARSALVPAAPGVDLRATASETARTGCGGRSFTAAAPLLSGKLAPRPVLTPVRGPGHSRSAAPHEPSCCRCARFVGEP